MSVGLCVLSVSLIKFRWNLVGW